MQNPSGLGRVLHISPCLYLSTYVRISEQSSPHSFVDHTSGANVLRVTTLSGRVDYATAVSHAFNSWILKYRFRQRDDIVEMLEQAHGPPTPRPNQFQMIAVAFP